MKRKSAHDYSLAALSVLSLSPPQQVDVAARTGYKYVGIRFTKVTPTEKHYDLTNDHAMMRETKARLDATSVNVLDVEFFRKDPETEPESYAATLDTTAELGAREIIAKLPDPDGSRKTARFARLCDLAKARGLRVSLEFPYWTEIGNLDAAAKVVRAVEKDNAGILIDTLHFVRSGSSLKNLAALPRR